jgi:hypothetical protein
VIKRILSICALAFYATHSSFAAEPRTEAVALPNPVVFVGQVPIPGDFTTVASTFGNHDGHQSSAPRGGDLFILYPTGTLKNVTRAAGLGNSGFQGAGSIAVREPSVHWSGTKVLFSMVIGGPTQQYQNGTTFFWQIYEATNLDENQTPVVTKVPNQPASFNNVSPIYGTDGRIIFTSDRPRNGEAHLYPQLDEYEEAPTVTGLWSLNPLDGDLRLLNHSPSGVFTPSIDSFGRLIFTRWDHLQRDQQADADAETPGQYGTFDFSNESAAAVKLNQRVEVFPEPRAESVPAGSNLAGLSINHFFPWMINEDGTSEETLNHIGRHELHHFFSRAFTDDPLVVDFGYFDGIRFNTRQADNTFQLREDPANPGLYYAVDSVEFDSHASGQIISLYAPPSLHADAIAVNWVTPRSTKSMSDPPAPADHSGHYRDPLPLSSGLLIAAHTADTRGDTNTGTRANPVSRYTFRLTAMDVPLSGFATPGETLTAGIPATISYWDPDVLVQWSGNLWELSPVELRARSIPTTVTTPLEQPEVTAFTQAGVEVEDVRQFMVDNDLALMVTRDVTTRDRNDKQQPFNLRVPGGVSHIPAPGQKVYDVSRLQLYQGDQIRGLGSDPHPTDPALVTGGRTGRRVLARAMHDSAAVAANPAVPAGTPPGSVPVALDGSVAAFVPARRAMSWQLTDPNHTAVVRERYWITMQPGEVRACGSCHGANFKTQMNQDPPTNTPAALVSLLQFWKSKQALLPSPPANFTATATSATSISLSWTASVGATPTTQYEIARSTGGSAFATIHTTATTSFPDAVSAGNVYVYKVRAIDTGGNSIYSTPDVATTFVFADDPLLPVTQIKAVHVMQLRQAVNALRTAAGLSAATFADPVLSSTTSIRAVHFQELRTALNQARTPLGVGSVAFTDAALVPAATKVRAVHLTELRNGLK